MSPKVLAAFFIAVLLSTGTTNAKDIGGPISTTLTITENSRLISDVTCTVSGASCIVIGAPSVTLDLNGFTITGLADPQTGCNGPGSAVLEDGIDVNGQTGVIIRGTGIVQQFRRFGIRLLNSSGVTVTGVTTATNCFSGIFVNGTSDSLFENNISVRNGEPANACGGI